ncbi:MAG: hypothetical protein Q8P18_29595 [Pseudomonadota bacterium]|nr:hypothetical protein [Pseudomonadota bacterium]
MVLLPIALLLAVNVFLNIWLPVVVNRQPERIKLTFDVAWMLVPGEVEVHNLEIRQQSPNDQWLMKIDNATATFALRDFLDHTIHITTAEAHGASFLWRARLDAPPPKGPPSLPSEADAIVGQADAAAPAAPAGTQIVADPVVIEDWSPPIPGFTNPPTPSPEDIYPSAKPWRVALHDVQVDRIRELWIGDYKYTGAATASGNLTLEANKWLEVEQALVTLDGGGVTRGSVSMLTGVQGQIELDLVGTNPVAFEGRGLFGAISGKVGLTAGVANLSFLDFYLQSAPWLHLTGGVGELVVDVNVEDGTFQNGSKVAADVNDIVARFLSYSVVGDGAVRLDVSLADGVPQTAIGVEFLDFAISLDGDATPHVKGQGFAVSATTADVALNRPFTSLDIVLELPEAEIPDVGVYNAYMPQDLGLVLKTGTGTVRGHLEVSTAQSLCHGELFLDGRAVLATLDELTLSGDVAVHAVVPSGNLETGKYDISGTSLELRKIRVISGGSTREGKDDSKAWWAQIKLPKGSVAVGAPIFLDGTLDVKFRDTVPFITVFSEKQPLPGWIRGLLGVEPVSGKARIRLGDDVLRVTDFQLFAGQFEVLLELRRRKEMVGKLYARFGKLSLGMGMENKKSHIQVFNAKKWYDAEPSPD